VIYYSIRNMKIIYRISDTGYNKIKPEYINNHDCLQNATTNAYQLVDRKKDWFIIADNISEETKNHIIETHGIPKENIDYVSIGHGAGTFNLALDKALTFDDDEIVYFLENDYLHKLDYDIILQEAFSCGADYATLYDHPDKYIPGSRGGNPYVDEDGGEITKVYVSKSCHWKLTNSTTMTFAAKVKTLKEDQEILRKWTNGKHPNDFQMFLELRDKGKALLSSIPGYSTHGETTWLSPLLDWSKI